MAMRSIVALFLFCLSVSGYAQQRSFCQLLVEGYNQSADGFPFLRSTTDGGTGDYRVSKDTLALYGLDHGFMHALAPVKSKKFVGYSYTEHYLYLYGPGQFKDAKSFTDIQQQSSELFVRFCDSYGKGCLPGLKRTKVYTDLTNPEDNNRNIYSCFFYFNEVQVPEEATPDQVKAMIEEVPFIHVAFRKRLIRTGYEMSFTIHGMKYIKQ